MGTPMTQEPEDHQTPNHPGGLSAGSPAVALLALLHRRIVVSIFMTRPEAKSCENAGVMLNHVDGYVFPQIWLI